MSNKYSKLVEQIDKQEEVKEQQNNLAEQLQHITTDVEAIKGEVAKLTAATTAIQNTTSALTTAANSASKAAKDINDAIQKAKEITITHQLDDQSIKQLKESYDALLKEEKRLLQERQSNINQVAEKSRERCYEIISHGDGAYFGRKTFHRLHIIFSISIGIIATELALALLHLLGVW